MEKDMDKDGKFQCCTGDGPKLRRKKQWQAAIWSNIIVKCWKSWRLVVSKLQHTQKTWTLLQLVQKPSNGYCCCPEQCPSNQIHHICYWSYRRFLVRCNYHFHSKRNATDQKIQMKWKIQQQQKTRQMWQNHPKRFEQSDRREHNKKKALCIATIIHDYYNEQQKNQRQELLCT